MCANVARGVTSTVLFGKETSYASGGTANKDIGLVQSLTLNPDSNVEERHGAGQAAAVYVKGGLVNVKGSIEFELQHGRPLELAIFGGVTSQGTPLTGDTVHTMVWSNTGCSLAGEVGWSDPDIKNSFTGLQFGSSTLSCTVDGILKMRGDLTGKTFGTGATATAAVINTGAPLGGFEAGLSMAGAVSYVQSWEVTVNRNAKTIFGAGSRVAAYGATHLANVTWKATIGLENATQINRLLGGTSISATEPASFTNIFTADNGIAHGSGKRALSMTLTGCQVKDFSINLTKGDFTLYDISGSGILGATTFEDQVLAASW